MKTVLRTVLSFPLAPYDADARDYITRVERADEQALETGVRQAIDAFVRGCKVDGIWEAIKASCILAGARTLSGALVPLKGTAPTNFNFVSGDYNRKTGLAADGSSKYLSSNRTADADPQDNVHLSCYLSTAGISGRAYIGSGVSTSTANNIYSNSIRCRSATAEARVAVAGFIGTSRAASGSYVSRNNSASATNSIASSAPGVTASFVFGVNSGGTPAGRTDARIAFYSIGESLDLALLDARVTTLVNTLNSVIP